MPLVTLADTNLDWFSLLRTLTWVTTQTENESFGVRKVVWEKNLFAKDPVILWKWQTDKHGPMPHRREVGELGNQEIITQHTKKLTHPTKGIDRLRGRKEPPFIEQQLIRQSCVDWAQLEAHSVHWMTKWMLLTHLQPWQINIRDSSCKSDVINTFSVS